MTLTHQATHNSTNRGAERAETRVGSFAGEITLKQLTKLLVQNELEDYDPVKEAFKASRDKTLSLSSH